MERFVATIIILGLLFTLATTFYAIEIPSYQTDCTDDLVRYKYTNKITREQVEYVGSSSCAPSYFGFFWQSKEYSLNPET